MSAPFRFRQFTIANDRAAMKVGTDGVLLGAWAPLGEAVEILDAGTGTGIIALMLAQRSAGGAHVTAIDIDPAAVEEAADNFRNSPWDGILDAECVSFQEFSGRAGNDARFDLIVSNPPFFSASLKAPDERRSAARHTDTLGSALIIEGSLRLLAPQGRLAIILPVAEGMDFVAEAEPAGLHLIRMCRVSTKSGKPAKRLLIEFSREATAPVFEELALDSEAFRTLTAEFYL